MPDLLGVVDVDVTALAASVGRLEARVAALEQALAAQAPRPSAPAAGVPPPDPIPTTGAWNVAGVVALSGRTLVALGGAYLLRALTDNAVLPPPVGVLAGFLYALLWAGLAMRGTGDRLRADASFHGLTSALVGFPLIWEATTRFALFGAVGAALALAVFSLILFGAARRVGVEAIAWFGGLGATTTALVLAVNTSGFVPLTVAAATVGVAAVWLGYLEEWVFLRWPIACVVDLMVLSLTLRVVDKDVAAPWTPALAVQLLVLAVYLGSFVGRSLLLGREVIVFEVVQSAAAMAVCFGGALWILSSVGLTPIPLGIAALTLGCATYAFAYGFAERRNQRRNVAFFSTLALAFTVAGVVITLSMPLAAAATAVLAISSSVWGRRTGRVTLVIHAIVFMTVTAGLAGLLQLAWSALVSRVGDEWMRLTVPHLAALVVALAVCLWPMTVSAPRRIRTSLRFTTGVLVTALVTGAAVAAAVPLVMDPANPDAGVVATIRTVFLVAAAAILVRRNRIAAEHVWLSYGILAVVGLKLVTEDLLRGRPATLFVALAVYGAALITIPRLARRTEPDVPEDHHRPQD